MHKNTVSLCRPWPDGHTQSPAPGKTSSEYQNSSGVRKQEKLGRSIEERSKMLTPVKNLGTGKQI